MEEQNEILQRLTRIETQLKGFIQYVNEDITEKNNDHEKRIRFLEKYYFMVAGGFTIVGVAIGFLIKFYKV